MLPPSKDPEPVASPVKDNVLAVSRTVALAAVPVKSPVIAPEALIVVKLPAAALEPPITVPSIAPPSMFTLLLACVAILPKPKFVLASPAPVAPVPPFATGNVPLTSDPNATAPADIVPEETLITPDDELKFCPVPPN